MNFIYKLKRRNLKPAYRQALVVVRNVMTQSLKSINLSRKLLRYCLASVLTSLIVGTGYFFYYRYQRSIYGVNTSREHIYRLSWEENCGITLSMLLPVILLYALAKEIFLKKNDHYGWNTLLFVSLAFGFFATVFSLTWGFQLSEEFTLMSFLLTLSPFFLFPLFLLKSRQIIKPLHTSPQRTI